MMDTLERFYIFPETNINNQINDRLTVKPNIIFGTIVQKTCVAVINKKFRLSIFYTVCVTEL